MRTCCILIICLSTVMVVSAEDINPSSPPASSGVEVAKLGSGKSFSFDDFGVVVAISEDQRTVVVGAPGWGSGEAIGAAYVFVEPPGGWTSTARYTAKLTNGRNNRNDGFGEAVGISGNAIVVGAPGVLQQEGPYGAAYVFVRPMSGWETTSKFAAELTGPQAEGLQGAFGQSVAIDSTTVAIGGAQNAAGAGVVFVFAEGEGGWAGAEPIAELSASDGFQGDDFGTSIAADGQTIVVGAMQNDSSQGPGAGEGYVFIEPRSGWTNGTETARLKASDGQKFDKFGISASVSGNTVVIGAWELNVGAGAAYVFVEPSTGWTDTTETAKLTANGAGINAEFGYATSIRGNTIFAGAPGVAEGFEFVKPSDGWKNTSQFRAKFGPDDGSLFGQSLSFQGNTLVVGSAGHKDTSPGAAFVIRH